ncbi:hypothetical protein OAI00_01380 [Euryarchaeota archaeon]|nr:hypothetical protein [Euryarchaeota archaeon]
MSTSTSSKDAIEQALNDYMEENPPPDFTPINLVERIMKILEKNQFRKNRSRPQKNIVEQIDFSSWED